MILVLQTMPEESEISSVHTLVGNVSYVQIFLEEYRMCG